MSRSIKILNKIHFYHKNQTTKLITIKNIIRNKKNINIKRAKATSNTAENKNELTILYPPNKNTDINNHALIHIEPVERASDNH